MAEVAISKRLGMSAAVPSQQTSESHDESRKPRAS
jgi:hypothetical protein